MAAATTRIEPGGCHFHLGLCNAYPLPREYSRAYTRLRVLRYEDLRTRGCRMAKRRKVSNLLGLTLLSQLTERPMYPYEMASVLRERGKDAAIKINWGSLYTVVRNLDKAGFIEALNVDRDGRQPERTTYQITSEGRAELTDWLSELLGEPAREYTSFEAGLGDCAMLGPDQVEALLRKRLETLDAANAEQEAQLGAVR